MMHLFSTKGRAALSRFLQEKALLVFDYDGTLAPIVSDRDAAYLRAHTRALLAAVAERHPTIILTGRARADVSRFLAGIPVLEIIGNHGMETEAHSDLRACPQVQDWRRELDERLETIPGVCIEDKRWSLSIHYRDCPQPERARDTVLRMAEVLDNVRVVGGKAVINLLPEDGAHKGQALLSACARHGVQQAIYVGDDLTDEDVFRHCPREQVLGVRIGKSANSSAPFYLVDQDEIDRLLARLRPPQVLPRALSPSAM